MKEPTISVIVASYNYQNYIKETLNSLINQTYKNFEVIIIDDGSSDNSIEIIKEYTQKHHNFHLFTHENNANKGLAATIQLGISKANGEYIAFCESDDYWDIHYIEEKINYLKQHPNAEIIANDIQPIGEKRLNSFIKNSAKVLRKKSGKNLFRYLFLCNKILPTFSTIMIKKYLLVTLDFNPCVLKKFLDYWLWRQAAYQTPIFFVDKKLTYWRLHKNSYATDKREQGKNLGHQFLIANNKILKDKYNANWVPIIYSLIAWSKDLKCIFSVRNSDDQKYKIITILGFNIFIKR